MAVLCGHHPDGGIERNLPAARLAVPQSVEIHTALQREGQQRRLGRVAERTPAWVGFVGRHELSVVAKHGGFEQGAQTGVIAHGQFAGPIE